MAEKEYFSQFGEDKVVSFIVALCWWTKHIVVDIGANDGWSWSNSRHFILKDWEAHLCEPIPKYSEIAKKHYSENQNVHVYEIAISDQDTELDFFIHKSPETDLLQMGSSLMKHSLPTN